MRRVVDRENTDASGVSMAAPLLGLTFAGDPVTLLVFAGVFLAKSPSGDVLVVPGGEGLAVVSGGAPAVAPGGGGSP